MNLFNSERASIDANPWAPKQGVFSRNIAIFLNPKNKNLFGEDVESNTALLLRHGEYLLSDKKKFDELIIFKNEHSTGHIMDQIPRLCQRNFTLWSKKRGKKYIVATDIQEIDDVVRNLDSVYFFISNAKESNRDLSMILSFLNASRQGVRFCMVPGESFNTTGLALFKNLKMIFLSTSVDTDFFRHCADPHFSESGWKPSLKTDCGMLPIEKYDEYAAYALEDVAGDKDPVSSPDHPSFTGYYFECAHMYNPIIDYLDVVPNPDIYKHGVGNHDHLGANLVVVYDPPNKNDPVTTTVVWDGETPIQALFRRNPHLKAEDNRYLDVVYRGYDPNTTATRDAWYELIMFTKSRGAPSEKFKKMLRRIPRKVDPTFVVDVMPKSMPVAPKGGGDTSSQKKDTYDDHKYDEMSLITLQRWELDNTATMKTLFGKRSKYMSVDVCGRIDFFETPRDLKSHSDWAKGVLFHHPSGDEIEFLNMFIRLCMTLIKDDESQSSLFTMKYFIGSSVCTFLGGEE